MQNDHSTRLNPDTIGASESDLKKIAAEIAGQDYSQMSYAELLALEVANFHF